MPLPGTVFFFGTPAFAVPTLEALCEAGAAPGLVVTQPPRAAGRGRRLRKSPVAERAAELDLPVVAEPSVRDEDFVRRVEARAPWVIVVVAFGQILPPALLAIPVRGCVNLHASLLPRHRGAAPIQAAIAAGEAVTGVTTMAITAGLDEGPILLQREVAIGASETAPELAGRLAAVGAELMLATLEGLAAGSIVERAQDHAAATYAPRLGKADGRVEWNLSARDLFNRWRALTPWPGLTARLAGADLKIVACRPSEGERGSRAAAGTIVAVEPDLLVACGGESALILERVQRPGRRAVSARDLVNGERLAVGDAFSSADSEPVPNG